MRGGDQPCAQGTSSPATSDRNPQRSRPRGCGCERKGRSRGRWEQLGKTGDGLGDAGHILVSKHVAEDLEEYEKWRPLLHDLGTCEVKHGMQIAIVNLCSDNVGNCQLPQKFRTLRKQRARVRWAEVAAALLLLTGIAAAFVFVSRKSARSTSIAPEKSIAVLPFENLSEEKANAFFADGVQDQILTDLARIADLKVISRISVMQYKSGIARNLREIGQQLGVAHVVEGSGE